MNRRAFVTALGAVLAAPLVAEAQTTERVYRIGIVSAGQTRSSPLYVAFEERLRELGYVDGRNLAVEFRGAEGDVGRLARLTTELVRLNIDLLLTGGPQEAVRTAKQATTRIPIVMVAIDFDPVASGYVAGLARPGGYITGLFLRQVELTAKRMALLKETLPKLTRVAILSDRFAVDQLKEAERATRELAMQPHVLELRTPPYDFEAAFGAAVQHGAEAVFVLSSPVFFRERDRLAVLALRKRLPTAYAFREWAEAGGLLSYGPNTADMYRMAAEYADKILKGAKPFDLPVQQPTKFELVINLKTAKTLGLTIPSSVLLRADQVIE